MQPGGSVPVEATTDVATDGDSRREARIPAGVDDARALRDAVLQTRDDLRASVAGLESQARAQGHLLNQIARACNGAARHGVPTGFDEIGRASCRERVEMWAGAVCGAVEMRAPRGGERQ